MEDPNTWPQFLCPNCRAISDLEAEVEDPTSMIEWEDDGNDDEFIAKKPETSEVNGTDTSGYSVNIHTSASDQDALLATIANRNLSVANNTDHGFTSQHQSLPDMQDSPDVLPRAPSPTHGVVLVDEAIQANSELLNGHHDHEGHVSTLPPLPRASTPMTSDQLTSEGPMTPTNDAGPFVFDGVESGRVSM